MAETTKSEPESRLHTPADITAEQNVPEPDPNLLDPEEVEALAECMLSHPEPFFFGTDVRSEEGAAGAATRLLTWAREADVRVTPVASNKK
jgi:hypothetical protein